MMNARRCQARTLALALNLALLLGVALPALAEEHRPHDDLQFTPVVETSFDALPDASATLRWAGVLNGAAYRIEVPAEGWNGQLVMWTHGYVSAAEPKLRAPNPIMRRTLLAKGFAWAASSYSKNGFDVRGGVEDTNALALEFPKLAAAHGKPLPAPKRLFIAGISMGGQIAGAAVERETLATARHRVRYAGALPMCGVMGDTELFDYLTAYGQAAGQLAGLPTLLGPAWKDVSETVRGTYWSEFPTKLSAQGERLRAMVMNLGGGARPFFNEGFADKNMQNIVWSSFSGDGKLDGVLNAAVTDTRQIQYRSTDTATPPSPFDVQFNTSIRRIAPTPDANRPRQDGLRWIPLLKAQFEVPVLTLHTLGDLYVPFSMEQIYRRRAIAAGSDGRLVQRAIRDVGHCAFTAAEAGEAFEDLLAWVDSGSKPAGDDVLDAAKLADPAYGCRFTRNQPSAQDYTRPNVRAAHQANYPACP